MKLTIPTGAFGWAVCSAIRTNWCGGPRAFVKKSNLNFTLSSNAACNNLEHLQHVYWLPVRLQIPDLSLFRCKIRSYIVCKIVLFISSLITFVTSISQNNSLVPILLFSLQSIKTHRTRTVASVDDATVSWYGHKSLSTTWLRNYPQGFALVSLIPDFLPVFWLLFLTISNPCLTAHVTLQCGIRFCSFFQQTPITTIPISDRAAVSLQRKIDSSHCSSECKLNGQYFESFYSFSSYLPIQRTFHLSIFWTCCELLLHLYTLSNSHQLEYEGLCRQRSQAKEFSFFQSVSSDWQTTSNSSLTETERPYKDLVERILSKFITCRTAPPTLLLFLCLTNLQYLVVQRISIKEYIIFHRFALLSFVSSLCCIKNIFFVQLIAWANFVI